MANWKVTPSTAYAVHSDASIAECVRIMREQGFGSILVSDTRNALVGIFTERDLLKWIDEIQNGGHWNKPISLLMSKPVFTLSIDDLDQAAEIMIERNIRHLPIVHHDLKEGKTLTGMVSMRDLLKKMVAQKKAAKAKQKQLRAGMISQNESIRHLIRKICATQGNIAVETLLMDQETDALVAQVQPFDYLFVDLDGIETKAWAELLKKLNALTTPPSVLLFYDSLKHPESELELFSKLSLSKHFSAYMKPVNIFQVVDKVSQ